MSACYEWKREKERLGICDFFILKISEWRHFGFWLAFFSLKKSKVKSLSKIKKLVWKKVKFSGNENWCQLSFFTRRILHFYSTHKHNCFLSIFICTIKNIYDWKSCLKVTKMTFDFLHLKSLFLSSLTVWKKIVRVQHLKWSICLHITFRPA